MALRIPELWRRVIAVTGVGFALVAAEPPSISPPSPTTPPSHITPDLAPIFPTGTDLLPIDLPTALQLAHSSNPTIAAARRRVDEARARLDQAQVLWLPNLQVGLAYQHHDGRILNSTGILVESNFSGLFAGGTASLKVDSGEALFAPLAARQLVEAERANARAVGNNIQLDVALAYLDLIQSYGALAINADLLARTRIMVDRAEAASKAGASKTTADVNRARTEYQLRRSERATLQARVGLHSATLARLLLLRPSVALLPGEAVLVPVRLVPEDCPLDDLLTVAVANRPELAATRAVSQAALTRYRQARLAPLMPRFQVEYNGGAFGGGPNDDLGHWGPRGEASAAAYWELRNLGLGDVAKSRERRAQYDQTQFHTLEIGSRVAEEVAGAIYQVRAKQISLDLSAEAVKQGLEMWVKLDRGSFGMAGPRNQYDALEPLLAIQALATARYQYLNDIVDYNRYQFRLYTALGNPPLDALPKAKPQSVELSPIPPPFRKE